MQFCISRWSSSKNVFKKNIYFIQKKCRRAFISQLYVFILSRLPKMYFWNLCEGLKIKCSREQKHVLGGLRAMPWMCFCMSTCEQLGIVCVSVHICVCAHCGWILSCWSESSLQHTAVSGSSPYMDYTFTVSDKVLTLFILELNVFHL